MLCSFAWGLIGYVFSGPLGMVPSEYLTNETHFLVRDNFLYNMLGKMILFKFGKDFPVFFLIK